MSKTCVTNLKICYVDVLDGDKRSLYKLRDGITCHWFNQFLWTRGVCLHKFFDKYGNKKLIYKSYSDHFDDVSVFLKTELTPLNKLTHKNDPPEEIIEWKKRKIIERITVKRNLWGYKNHNNNYYYQNLNDNSYSFVCVKKEMLEKKYETDYYGSLVGTHEGRKYWCEKQLFIDPANKKNHFVNDIDLQNLDFNLDEDEDLVFINDITFDSGNHYIDYKYDHTGHYSLNQVRKQMGMASNDHTDTEIVITYKNSYF